MLEEQMENGVAIFEWNNMFKKDTKAYVKYSPFVWKNQGRGKPVAIPIVAWIKIIFEPPQVCGWELWDFQLNVIVE